MRTKNVAYGSLATALTSIITLLSGLIIPRQIILAFGSELNGISNSITQFISYFNLLEAGLAGSAIYALYKPYAQKDFQAINGILSASKRYYDRISLLYLSGVIVFSAVFSLQNTDIMPRMEVFLLSVAIGIGGVLQFSTMAKYRVLLTATQKTYVVALATSASIITKIIVVYVALLCNSSIIVVKLLAALTILVRSLILYIYVRKHYKQVSYTEQPTKDALQQRGDVLLSQVLGSVQKAFPTIAMTITGIGYSTISIYTVYMSVIIGVRSVLDVILNGSIYSTFGEIISLGQYDVLHKALGKFEVLCYGLISILFSCLLVLFMPFMNIYAQGMADANYIQPNLAFFLVLSTFVAVIRYPLSAMIQAAGHYRKTRSRTITQASIAVVFALVLAKPFGLYGLLAGFLASDLYFTITVLEYVPHKITRTSSWVSVKRILLTIAAILISWLTWEALFSIHPSSYLVWFLYAMVVGLWSMFVTVVLNLIGNPHESKELWKMTKKLLYKLRLLGA